MDENNEIQAALKPATTPRVKNKLEEAKETAEKLESLNAMLEEKLQRLENLQVESTLSGRSLVRNVQEREDTDTEYADKVMRGEMRGE